jgi:hypothetical protein
VLEKNCTLHSVSGDGAKREGDNMDRRG